MSSQINRRDILLSVIALVAVGIIVWLNSQKSLVPIAANYEQDVQRLVDQAASADQDVLARFDHALASAMVKYQTESLAAAESAAATVGTYTSIVHLIGSLAYDQLNGTDKAGEYLQAKLGPPLKPPVDALAVDLNAATAELENELQKISVQLAVDLAALGPGASAIPRKFTPTGQVQQDFDNALRNLGISAAAVGVAAFVDIYAIANTTVIRTFVTTLGSIARQLFAKQVTKTTIAVTAAVADGPMPVGDVIAIVFGIGTLYDISRLKPEFHEQVKNVSVDQLREMGTQCEAQAREHAKGRVESFKSLQSKIGIESLKELAR